MIRCLALLAVLVMSTTGCGSADAVGQASEGIDAKGPPSNVAVVPEIETEDNSSGFDLSFVVDQRPPSVVVGAVKGATITAYERPDATSPALVELSNPNGVGGPLIFQLLAPEPAGDEWVEVLLPARPNGITGWVRNADLELSVNPYRIEIDIAQHQLRVLKANELWMTTTVGIGTGATPTPVGRFYITELLKPPTDDGPYGPFAFGLSGYSETLTNYAGGEGVIGIHGTNEPESLGTDVSHGCVRLANDEIETLAVILPLGTPVIIQP